MVVKLCLELVNSWFWGFGGCKHSTLGVMIACFLTDLATAIGDSHFESIG